MSEKRIFFAFQKFPGTISYTSCPLYFIMSIENPLSDPELFASLSKHFSNTDVLIKPIGSGIHAAGFIGFLSTEPDKYDENIFIRRIGLLGFGHELPPARLASMLEAREALPNTLKTHAILLISPDGTITEIPSFAEAVTISQLLPHDAEHMGTFMRQPQSSKEGHEKLAEQVHPIAEAMTELMAAIHAMKFEGDREYAASLYQRATRAIIHDPELTAGVIDFANPPTQWMSHEDGVLLIADMERVRHTYGIHPERLCHIHGDFWTNNTYRKPNGELIITDRRLILGDPATDAGWVIGEFLMQDLVRFGAFGNGFTKAIEDAMHMYVEKTGDMDIYRYMHLPYAFQTLAEATFTPDITDGQRRLIFATGVGALQDGMNHIPFDFHRLNIYTQNGIDRLKSSHP